MKKFIESNHGNVAVISAMAASVLAAVAGLAILMGQDVQRETHLQAALDAGVLAGTSLPHGAKPEARVASAEKAFFANISDAVFGGEGKDGGVEFAADDMVKPVFTVSKSKVSGTATSQVKNTLGASLGITKSEAAAFAQAEKMLSEPVCVLALNETNPSSLYVYGNAQFNVKNCAVQANSADGSGMEMSGKASSATAAQFGVTGSYGGNAENWTPKPITGTEPVDDPYASLPVPEPGTCIDIAAKLRSASYTLEPGTYCGGINIKAGASVTLEPGIYIIKDGQLAINSGANVIGEEVMIAFVGANAYLDVKSNATVKISSPASGTYKNIQMMSDRELSDSKFEQEWTTIFSGAKLEYDGVIYMPEQQFWVSGTAHEAIVKGSSPSMVMVVDTIWAQGNAVFDLRREDKRGTGGDGIVATFGYGARLVR